MFFNKRGPSGSGDEITSRSSTREVNMPRDETSETLASWMNPAAMIQSFFGRRRLFDDDPFFNPSHFGFGSHGQMDHFMSDNYADFAPGVEYPKKGKYTSQMMFTSTEIGPDGQPKTKRYLQHTSGDADKQIRQTRQAYSGEGLDRYAMERHIGNKGRRVVRERNRRTGDENQTDTITGMNDDERQAFDAQWSRLAHQLQGANDHSFPRALQQD